MNKNLSNNNLTNKDLTGNDERPVPPPAFNKNFQQVFLYERDTYNGKDNLFALNEKLKKEKLKVVRVESLPATTRNNFVCALIVLEKF